MYSYYVNKPSLTVVMPGIVKGLCQYEFKKMLIAIQRKAVSETNADLT